MHVRDPLLPTRDVGIAAAVTSLATDERSTLKNRVYRAVRDALMTGQFEPGEPVIVKPLANALGAGVMPVREAIQRLVTEGALAGLSNGRVCVPRITRAEFQELFEIRLLLEPFACTKAALQATDDERSMMRDCLEAVDQSTRGGVQPEEILLANYRFHFSIYEAGHSRQLVANIQTLWLRFGPLLIFPLRHPIKDWSRYILRERRLHRHWIAAVCDGSAALAKQRAREVIDTTQQWYLANFPFSS